MTDVFDVVVVGGGIAGVTCVESLLLLDQSISMALVCSTPCVKCTTNVVSLGHLMQKFDVIEQDQSEFHQRFPSVTFIHGTATTFDSGKHVLFYKDSSLQHTVGVNYKKLCICSGAVPNVAVPISDLVITIRDIDSVEQLQRKLKTASHIALLGNGGIANELVCEVDSCDITWIVKDNFINSAFLDPGAAEFLKSHIKDSESKLNQKYVKRWQYDASKAPMADKLNQGPALGPDWHKNLSLHGVGSKDNVNIQYCCSVESVEEVSNGDNLEHKKKLKVVLTNNHSFECDLLVSATGVFPSTSLFDGQHVKVARDGGILVNESFETSIPDVYAAGDCCTPGWELAPHWIHMRLWTQAKQMGTAVARSMLASLQGDSPLPLDICFDVFTHVTTFFGFKVILLGNFNAKNLCKDECEFLLRCTKDKEYIKVVLHQGRMCGAILIGETDYEETFENLILNQFDLDFIKDGLLDPDVDIDDYFD